MAQPLPRFEELGVRVGQAPPISSAGAEAAARTGQTLAENLTRLSSFAFEEANKEARVLGLEYGAANAPTAEQTRIAAESGKPIEVPGGTSSTFGRAAREGALSVMEMNLAAEARDKMAELHVRAVKSEMAPDSFQKELNSIIDGYGSALAKVSPATSAGLRAKLASDASSKYVAHADWFIKKQEAKTKMVAMGEIEKLIASIDEEVSGGDRIIQTENGSVVSTIDSRVAPKRTEIVQHAMRLNDPTLMKTKLDEFQKKLFESKRNFITKSTHGDDGVPTAENYFRTVDNSISDPTKDPKFASYKTDKQIQMISAARMWNGMSEEERNQTRDHIRTQMSQSLAIKAQMNTAADYDRTRRINSAKIEAQKAFMTPGTEGEVALKAALDKLEEENDADGFKTYATLAADNGVSSHQATVFNLKRLQINGQLTEEAIVQQVADRNLSHSDARSFLQELSVSRDKNFDEAMSYVRDEFQAFDKSIMRMANMEAQNDADKKVMDLHKRMIMVRREKPDINLMEWAKAEVGKLKQEGPKATDIDTARIGVAQLRKDLGVPVETSLDDLNRALTGAIDRGNPKFNNPGVISAARKNIEILKSAEAK